MRAALAVSGASACLRYVEDMHEKTWIVGATYDSYWGRLSGQGGIATFLVFLRDWVTALDFTERSKVQQGGYHVLGGGLQIDLHINYPHCL